jgi:hypothetical protein
MLATLHRFLWWLSYQFNPITGFVFGALISLVLPLDDGFIATLAGNVVRAFLLGVLGAFLFMFLNDVILDHILLGVIHGPK